jgi:hypothetical protein
MGSAIASQGVRSSRRRFLVAAALAGTAVLPGCGGGRTAPRYGWRKGAMGGGGYCNAMATDPHGSGRAAAAGDVWGEYATESAGALWYPTMAGATSIGEIYGRAVAYSERHPGVRYFGVGVLSDDDPRHGYLGVVEPGSLRLERRNDGITFSSRLPHGASHELPRAVGHLIAVDDDHGRGLEYLYALSREGLVRSTDGGGSFAHLGLGAPAPHAAWSALCVCPDGSLLAASFRTSYRSGSRVWRIRSPRAHPRIATEPAAPAVVEDIAAVDGVVYAACGPYGLYRVDSQGAWTAVSPGSFGGCHLSSVAGHSGVLWVGNGIGMTDHRYIARSHDRGRTFVWTTRPANVSDEVLGLHRRWWLASSWPGLGKDGYSVSQLAVDPRNANTCYSAGRAGVVATRDGGGTWQPATNGLDGSQIRSVQAGPAPAEAWATDTDWTAIHTTDHWRTCTRIAAESRVPRLKPPALVRERDGNRYQVVLSNPRRMMVDGVDVADDDFRAACITPTDLAVSSDHHIYIGLNGGGVLVGATLAA